MLSILPMMVVISHEVPQRSRQGYCDMRFHLCWNRNPIYNKPEFCPFCGEEIEETIDETNDDL
jgi:hypothetical protein